MNVKTLALAAAAAAAATSAQAADLPLAAEPVNYVKACDAFGAGYFQLPGKDTCIKLGGRIRAQYVSHNLQDGLEDVTGKDKDGKDITNDWSAYTRGYLYFTSMTATDIGTIKTFTELTATWDQNGSGENGIGDAWVQIGADYGTFLFGRESSVFDGFTGYTWIVPGGISLSDVSTLQASFTADLGNGFTAAASVEDSSYRGGDENAVDFIGALKVSQGWGSFQLSGAAHNKADGDGYGYAAGATATFNLDMVREGTEITFQAQYADEAGAYITSSKDDAAKSGYSLSGGLETALSDKVSAQLDVSHVAFDDDSADYTKTSVNGSIVYSPVAGLGLALAAGWNTQDDDDAATKFEDETKIGARVQYTF
ncbi:Porin subfamily protein [Pseudovibrio denitrificans]|uniref:Porin n=1 Tax=Pseudovibrio denitrificans TaxID=258256 RepID=A0A1I7BNC1_9HYPH|nr:porin [Pseudovibrio denitrificans]SFT88571.1 Porin subfamily protein [Pseudovibrio denitrificans]